MLPRERLVATLRHQKPDRVPRDAWFTPGTLRLFREATGADDPAEYYEFEHRSAIQPESMDPFRIKRRWGDRLTHQNRGYRGGTLHCNCS